MKLYMWDGVLADWSGGIAFAFALANSPEEAVEKLIAAGLDAEYFQGIAFVEGDTRIEPKVYDSPAAFFLHGVRDERVRSRALAQRG